MAYVKTTWVDEVTPVSAANLNKLEQGVSDAHAGLVDSSRYAFHAIRSATSGNLGAGVNGTIGANTELYDYGGAYDAVTNQDYVAPFDGIYHFDVLLVITNVTTGSRWRVFLWNDAAGAAVTKLRDVAMFQAYAGMDARITGGADVWVPAGAHVEPRVENIDNAVGQLWANGTRESTGWNGHLVART